MNPAPQDSLLALVRLAFLPALQIVSYRTAITTALQGESSNSLISGGPARSGRRVPSVHI